MSQSESFLLDTEQLEGLRPKALRDAALERFGEVPMEALPASATQEACLKMLANDEARSEWQRCVGAELLLGRLRAATGGSGCPADFRSVRPFGEGSPTLEALWTRPVASVIIPIKTDGRPVLAQLWLVGDPKDELGEDHRKNWKTADEWLDTHAPGYKLFSACSQEFSFAIEGPSWQLGAFLARRGLEQSIPEVLIALASQWIVTGRVKDGFVHEVSLGNKTDLKSNRSWMLPEANWKHLTPEFRTTHARHIALVPNLSSAWSHLTGIGTVEETATTDWPAGENVEAFHGLVSNAIRPMIASILYTRPRQVLLWVSTQFEKTGGMVRAVLERLAAQSYLPAGITVALKSISSASMPEAENDLRTQGALHLPSAKTTVFNITGGNMLMKYAVINLAALNPQLWLIYRDLDAGSSHHFTRLRSSGAQLAAATIVPEESRRDINWTFLFEQFNPGKPPDTVDSLMEGIVRKEAQ